MMTACSSFGLPRVARVQRSACLLSGVLLWGGLDGCAQVIGIEIYEESDVRDDGLGDPSGAGAGSVGGLGAGAAPGDGVPDAGSADPRGLAGSAGGSSGEGAGLGGGAPLVCRVSARRCTDNAVELCTVGGAWQHDELCVDRTCSADGDDATCAGECAPGQVACRAGDAYECDRGEWDLADACSSTEVCRSGACLEARRDVGNATVLAGTVSQPSDTLILYRLPALAHDAVLEHFGIAGDVDGVQARLVLYGDGPDGVSPAGAVIAQSGGLSFGLAAGSMVTAAPASPETVLSGGVAYWLGVVSAEPTTLRAAPGATTALRVVPFAPFNAPFGAAEAGQLGPELHLDVFIGVRELP
jgi:hypothetical protein